MSTEISACLSPDIKCKFVKHVYINWQAGYCSIHNFDKKVFLHRWQLKFKFNNYAHVGNPCMQENKAVPGVKLEKDWFKMAPLLWISPSNCDWTHWLVHCKMIIMLTLHIQIIILIFILYKNIVKVSLKLLNIITVLCITQLKLLKGEHF